MHCPRQISAQRAIKRFGGKSGRYVPIDVILANTTNEKTFEQLKPLCSKWSFRDSSGNPPPEKVAESNKWFKMQKSINEDKRNPKDKYDFGKVTKKENYSKDLKERIANIQKK